jgi:hypothetical protein
MFPQKFTGSPSAEEFWVPHISRLRYCRRRKHEEQGHAEASRWMEDEERSGDSFEQPVRQDFRQRAWVMINQKAKGANSLSRFRPLSPIF